MNVNKNCLGKFVKIVSQITNPVVTYENCLLILALMPIEDSYGG